MKDKFIASCLSYKNWFLPLNVGAIISKTKKGKNIVFFI